MRKKTNKFEEPSFLRTLLLAFDKFGFLNFANIDIEKFAGTNFAITVTETLHFDIQFYPPSCDFVVASFLKLMFPS